MDLVGFFIFFSKIVRTGSFRFRRWSHSYNIYSRVVFGHLDRVISEPCWTKSVRFLTKYFNFWPVFTWCYSDVSDHFEPFQQVTTEFFCFFSSQHPIQPACKLRIFSEIPFPSILVIFELFLAAETKSSLSNADQKWVDFHWSAPIFLLHLEWFLRVFFSGKHLLETLER